MDGAGIRRTCGRSPFESHELLGTKQLLTALVDLVKAIAEGAGTNMVTSGERDAGGAITC